MLFDYLLLRGFGCGFVLLIVFVVFVVLVLVWGYCLGGNGLFLFVVWFGVSGLRGGGVFYCVLFVVLRYYSCCGLVFCGVWCWCWCLFFFGGFVLLCFVGGLGLFELAGVGLWVLVLSWGFGGWVGVGII